MRNLDFDNKKDLFTIIFTGIIELVDSGCFAIHRLITLIKL